MGFFLFVLVNATLFLRPAELAPELTNLPFGIYEVLILSCLAVSLPQVLDYFLRRPLVEQPITLGVFGILLAVVLSHLANGALELAASTGYEFAKVVVYYVLLVSVVNTPSRLRQFLFWVMLFCVLLTGVAVLRYYEVVEIKTPVPVKVSETGLEPPAKETEESGSAFVKDYEYDPERGELVAVLRLRGTGIFQDPNDLSMVLAIGFLLALYWLLDGSAGQARLAALAPLALFLWAFALTQSRGGFLCLVAGLLTALVARFGWRKTMWLSLLGLPALLALFAGRMTSLSATEGTGQSRIQIWSDGLLMFRQHPLFGVGMDQFGTHAFKVAHNSYIHAYAELGLFGGTLFLGVIFFALVGLARIGRGDGFADQPAMQRTQPFLMAVVVAYAVAMMSLSRGFTVPTYLVLGLVTAYANLYPTAEEAPVLRLDTRLLQRLAYVSVLFLAGTYVFVRVFFRGA
jgi:hypothetical protein